MIESAVYTESLGPPFPRVTDRTRDCRRLIWPLQPEVRPFSNLTNSMPLRFTPLIASMPIWRDVIGPEHIGGNQDRQWLRVRAPFYRAPGRIRLPCVINSYGIPLGKDDHARQALISPETPSR